MVYESDFYTTRRPYRPSPSVSSYTVSYYYPSRQVRILPGIGRVHVVHSYDRIIPYVGHKRLTVVPTTGHVYRVRPSVIVRELSRIQHKVRPYVYFSPTSHYLNSETARMFDDESRYIRAQSAALLKRLQYPVPRVQRSWPITTVSRYEPPTSLRITPVDEYINRMLAPIKNVKQDIYNISHYYTTDLNRKYIGRGHLSCVSYAGDKAYDRRRNYTVRDIYLRQNDTVRNDIQLLSYYIKNMRDKKAIEAASHPALSPTRPSRVFSQMKMLEDEKADIKEMKEARAQRLAKIYAVDDTPKVDVEGARIKRATKQKEEERALEEEKAKKEEARKKEEAARKAELARQEALAAQAAAERAAELERKAAEQARKEEEAKKAEQARIEAEKKKKEEEKKAAELARQEEERKAELARQEEERKAELARQEEERQQLLRLEEIARQAEEEKEKELARQAEELAELARQEAELAEAARKEAELAELAKKEAELAELERQEKELAELDRKERELAEAAKQEAEMAEQQKEAEEIAVLSEVTPAQVLSPEPAEEVAEPVVEEPVTPDVQDTADESKPTAEEVEEEEEEEE